MNLNSSRTEKRKTGQILDKTKTEDKDKHKSGVNSAKSNIIIINNGKKIMDSFNADKKGK